MTGIQYVSNTWLILAPLKFLSLPQLPPVAGTMWHHVAPCGTMWHLMQPQFEGKDPLPLPPEDPEDPEDVMFPRWLIHIDPSQLSSGQHDVPHRLQGRADPGVLQKSPAAVVFSHQLSSPQQEV